MSESRQTMSGARVARWLLAGGIPAALAALLWPGLGTELRVTLSPALGWEVGFDKVCHATLGGVVTLLLLIAARSRGRAALLVLAWALFSPATEYLQRLCGRGYEVDDMLAHVTGMGVALVAAGGWRIADALTFRYGVHGKRDDDAANDTGTAAPAKPGPSDHKPASKPRGFLGAAMTVSALTFLSRITGLVRDSYLAAAFGIGGVSDAFWFGFSIPNLFRRLFGEGALTAAFIPIYTDLLHHHRELARRFASLCLALTAVTLGVLTILGLAGLTGSLFVVPWTPGTALALRLTVIMLPYMPLVCLVAIVGAMLQVHGRFAPAAGMPILLNVVMILATAVPLYYAKTHGGVTHAESTQPAMVSNAALRNAAYIVSFSVVAAGLFQLVSQTVLLLRHERFTKTFEGTRPALMKLMKSFLPMLMALAVFQVNTFMDTMIAFGLSPKEGGETQLHLLGHAVDFPVSIGGNTALQNAQRLYQFPLGVFGLAIATAIFPALAHAAAERKTKRPGDGRTEVDAFRDILRQGLRLTVFIGLPASVGLVLIREPLSRLVYGWGRVRTEDYKLVASILAGYAPAIWAYSMTHVITRAFYALKDARTPLIVSVLMVVLNLLLNLVLIWTPLGAAGLAYSTAIAAIVQNVLLLRAMAVYMDRPVDAGLWKAWGRTALNTLAMSAAVAPAMWAWDPTKGTKIDAAIRLMLVVLLGGGVYLAVAWLLKAEELAWLTKKIKRKRIANSQ